jgi:isopenicillin N synthase-like dioxygenase
MTTPVPIIDVGPLLLEAAAPLDMDMDMDMDAAAQGVARAIALACRSSGFFYITNHGIDAGLQQRLEAASRRFFALPAAQKLAIHMSRGGRAWRGYFPVGEELTSGRPDRKEGLYCGAELAASHPLVQAQMPLHGPNLFPSQPAELGPTVLAFLEAMTRLAHRLMEGIALSLGLQRSYFAARYTSDPLILFRIFHYPPATETEDEWGVGEHTDYGILTILKQDDAGGLEVKTRDGWVAAPPVPDSFVCNIGDMLERMTGGLYRSTPHRVRNLSGRGRLSFPFFFDPNFFAPVRPIELADSVSISDEEARQRWDGANVHVFSGTYGDYVLSKVGKVFPELLRAVL